MSSKDIVDNQIAIIEYENGVRASFHTNCSSGLPERRIYICGSKGTIRADFVKGQIEIKKLDSKDVRIIYTESDEDGHGGGDPNLVETLNRLMISDNENDKTLKDSMDQAIISAVTCIMIDSSMENKKVVDMESVWRELG